jgi:aldehyde:ferredoxin oxidoreductase
VGKPPLTAGPLAGVTIDHERIADDFFQTIGWDKEKLVPTKESLEAMGGMADVVKDFYR